AHFGRGGGGALYGISAASAGPAKASVTIAVAASFIMASPPAIRGTHYKTPKRSPRFVSPKITVPAAWTLLPQRHHKQKARHGSKERAAGARGRRRGAVKPEGAGRERHDDHDRRGDDPDAGARLQVRGHCKLHHQQR